MTNIIEEAKLKEKVGIIDRVFKALLQNYGFRKPNVRLPTINFVYPSFTANENIEEFKFSQTLERELREREYIVREDLRNKKVIWTANEDILLESGEIAPRLGIEEQINGKINSIYSYSPLLFLGANENNFSAYVVKPLIDTSMAWFEFTDEERNNLRELFVKKAEERPYRSLIKRILRRK